MGTEIKGARRWISLGFISIQPSEFLKPAFAVVAAWLFASARTGDIRHGNLISIATFGILISLLLLQPDIGMSVVISAVWATQFFLAGLPLCWAAILLAWGIGALVIAYFVLPHVASRVDRFLDPSSGDSYQVDRSLEAFMNGGLFGRGPGEGTVKEMLPDAHSDFVFAVAGEEFGLFVCLILVALFAFIVLRGFGRALQGNQLVYTTRHIRPTSPIWSSSGYKYELHPAAHAHQGNDSAIRILRRLVVNSDGFVFWISSRANSQTHRA